MIASCGAVDKEEWQSVVVEIAESVGSSPDRVGLIGVAA